MDWQLGIALALVGAAALYLGWTGWKSLTGTKKGCGGSCGCSAASRPAGETPRFIPSDELTLRRRDASPP